MREEIEDFAEKMEEVMSEYDEEKGNSWKDTKVDNLRNKLGKEYEELRESAYMGEKEKDELVDLANYCMMIWIRLKEDRNNE